MAQPLVHQDLYVLGDYKVEKPGINAPMQVEKLPPVVAVTTVNFKEAVAREDGLAPF